MVERLDGSVVDAAVLSLFRILLESFSFNSTPSAFGAVKGGATSLLTKTISAHGFSPNQFQADFAAVKMGFLRHLPSHPLTLRSVGERQPRRRVRFPA
jgi:hypothetical protein